MVPVVGMLVSITSVQAKLVLSHRPMFLACCPVHIVAREGVHCGTVQYWLARLTPAPTSRWIAGRSTPGGRSMCTSHWSMHSTRMFGRLVPWLFTAAPYCWSALLFFALLFLALLFFAQLFFALLLAVRLLWVSLLAPCCRR